MNNRVLVTRRIYPEALALLEAAARVDYHDTAEGLSAAELEAAVADKHAIVCQLTDRIDAAVIDAGADLKVIANVAVGYDNIDLAAASARGIVVTNTPGVLTETTADLAFALMLAAGRRIVEADRFLRAGRWRRWQIDLLCGHDVHQKTLGILGFGRIGRAVARRARGFGMRMLYHSPAPVAARVEREHGVEYADRESLFRRADYLSIHVPLNEHTRHLVGANELELMKPTAVLVNTSRGPVVDEAALARALASRRIAAAGLDVFEAEPEVSPKLIGLDNVVLVPHIGSASIETRTRMCTMAAENAIAVLQGERPPNPVDRE